MEINMKHKRATILYIAMSLDGYIADENTNVDWLSEVDGDGDNGYSAFYETVDTIIMGRTTYDQILSFGCEWPYLGKQCYVFTDRQYAHDDISVFMRNLKSKPGLNIWLAGGAEMAHSFLKAGLIDEFAITMIPTILGKGVRLFKPDIPKIKLTLKNQMQFKNIAFLHYIADK